MLTPAALAVVLICLVLGLVAYNRQKDEV